jgi:hypothetical protein
MSSLLHSNTTKPEACTSGFANRHNRPLMRGESAGNKPKGEFLWPEICFATNTESLINICLFASQSNRERLHDE